jgi:hypothetical protein
MAGVAAFAAALSAPVAAQSRALAKASDPVGLVMLLEGAGYQPKLSKDETGDPMIDVDLGGYRGMIYFYGCDEAAHDQCQSLQFQAGFNRDKPWTANDAIALAKKFRFSSVHLDDEGDPWVKWDVITGEGIPAKVFLTSVEYFTDVVADSAEIIFADEPET